MMVGYIPIMVMLFYISSACESSNNDIPSKIEDSWRRRTQKNINYNFIKLYNILALRNFNFNNFI